MTHDLATATANDAPGRRIYRSPIHGMCDSCASLALIAVTVWLDPNEPDPLLPDAEKIAKALGALEAGTRTCQKGHSA